MTPEERFDRIEQNLQSMTERQAAMTAHQAAQQTGIDKMLDAAGKLILVGRTCLDSIGELREVQRKDHEEWTAQIKELREAQAATDEKLNILIDTVDRIIRHRNGKE